MNLMRFVLYGAEYRPPEPSVNVDICPSFKPKPLLCERLVCKGKEAGQAVGGFLADSERFQNLPVTEATVIDAHKSRKPVPEISGTSDLALAWALASTKASWGSIARRLEKMALAVIGSDPEFSGDLQLLAAIARRHGGIK